MTPDSTRESTRRNRNRAAKTTKNDVVFEGATERICALLRAEPTKPYNPTTISHLTLLPLSTVTRTLLRLIESGRICKLDHGIYAARDVTRPFSRRRLNAREPFLHNLTILLPSPKQMSLSIHPPTSEVGERRTYIRSREQLKKTTLRPFPESRLKVTILHYPDKLMAVVGGSDDPLSPHDFLWLLELLRAHTGKDWRKGTIVKRDINLDLRHSLSGANEAVTSLRDVCLAVYRKGQWTRAELRNYTVPQPVAELVAYLRSTLEPPRRPEPAAPLARDDEGAMYR